MSKSFLAILFWGMLSFAASAQLHPLEGRWICENECLLLGEYSVKAFTVSSESEEFIAAAIYEEDGAMNLVADFKLKSSGNTLKLALIFSAIENTPPKGSKFSIKWAIEDHLLLLKHQGKTYIYNRLVE